MGYLTLSKRARALQQCVSKVSLQPNDFFPNWLQGSYIYIYFFSLSNYSVFPP